MELAVAFQTELSGGGAVGPESRSGGAAQEARRAWELRSSGSRAGRRRLRPLPGSLRNRRGAVPPLEQLHVEDLYLACACACAVAGAAARFEERCGPRLKAVLGAAVKSADLRAEIRQRVLDLLLVGRIDMPAKILGYGGQGPIDSWTAVVAQRQLTMLLRKDEIEQRAREGAALETALSGGASPEVAFAKHRYRAELSARWQKRSRRWGNEIAWCFASTW